MRRHAYYESVALGIQALTTAYAITLTDAHSMSTGTADKRLILVGDNPEPFVLNRPSAGRVAPVHRRLARQDRASGQTVATVANSTRPFIL
jgi:hypothetical protein